MQHETQYEPIAPVIFDVVSIKMFEKFFSWSICVNKALTTRIASEGSDPDIADVLAPARLSTSSIVTSRKLDTCCNYRLSYQLRCIQSCLHPQEAF